MESTHKSSIRVGVDGVLRKLKHLDLTGSVQYDSKYPIAQGGFGDVFKGQYDQLGGTTTYVAIKRLRTYLSGQLDTTRVFKREIKAWSRLEHPNILPLLGYIVDETGNDSPLLPSLVSEWMENGNILDFIKRDRDCDIAKLVLGMAEGLTYLHTKEIVHADLKSGNVLISPACEALISDFGAAHISHDSQSAGISSTISGTRGTIRWLAYELLADSAKYTRPTKESDIWSFGMTLLEVLTNERPYLHLKHNRQVMYTITQKQLPPTLSDLGRGWKNQIWEVCISY